jgi:hypothetical protein
MLSKEKQADVLSCFHDGGFTELNRDGNDIRFFMEINYIAELIDPDYTGFQCILTDCKEIFFELYGGRRIDNLVQILELDLEIGSAEVADDKVMVYCRCCKDLEGNWCTEDFGGILYFNADDLRIFNEAGMEMSLDELLEVCNRYWANHD